MSADNRSKSRRNGGSAAGHILILLVLAVGCYFGVKSFYKVIDSKYIGEPESLPVVAGSDMSPGLNQYGEYGEKGGEIDREAITRRNLFLTRNTDNSADYTDDLLAGLKPSEADLILVGTIIDSDGTHRAIIFNVEQKNRTWLEKEML